MTGRRARLNLRLDAEQRYPQLAHFFGGYLHQDWPEFYGTPEKAIEVAISEYSVELRQRVCHELVLLLTELDDDRRLQAVMNDGLGVYVRFRSATEARMFAESVGRKLLASITGHFEQQRRPRT